MYFFTGVDAERDSRGGTSAEACASSPEKNSKWFVAVDADQLHRLAVAPATNQIIGGGDAKGGEVRVLYDPKKSMDGVTKALGKVSRRTNEDFARIDIKEIGDAANALRRFKQDAWQAQAQLQGYRAQGASQESVQTDDDAR